MIQSNGAVMQAFPSVPTIASLSFHSEPCIESNNFCAIFRRKVDVMVTSNNNVMLLKLSRSVIFIIWTLHYYLSCIFTTVEVYSTSILKFCFSSFCISYRHLLLSLRSLLRSITQILSSSVTMPISTKTVLATAAAALFDN